MSNPFFGLILGAVLGLILGLSVCLALDIILSTILGRTVSLTPIVAAALILIPAGSLAFGWPSSKISGSKIPFSKISRSGTEVRHG